jgi:hypothetical protein
MTRCIWYEPFGLLTIAAAQHKLVTNYSGDFTMHRALVSTIFAGLFAFVAAAHSHPKTTPPIIKPEASAQVTLQSASDAVKVRAPRELAVTAAKAGAPPAESGWSKYGTLLATLVVMGAIAVRRQRLGQS